MFFSFIAQFKVYNLKTAMSTKYSKGERVSKSIMSLGDP